MIAATVAAVLALAGSTSARAVGAAVGEASPTRPAPELHAEAGKHLNQAARHLAAGRFDRAKQILVRMKQRLISPYELSRACQMLAVIAQHDKDFPAARAQLQAAIESGGSTPAEISRQRFQIAQLLMAEGSWKEGVAALEAWIHDTPDAGAEASYLLALGDYQLADYESALGPAQHAVDATESPRPSWLDLLLALRIVRQEFREARPIAERIVAIDPSKQKGWMQLSSLDAQLGDREDAAAVLQSAEYGGILKELEDVRRLAEVLLWRGVPYRAAVMLDAAIASHPPTEDPSALQTLASCWIAAREYERALAPLRAFAERAPDGSGYLSLGRLLIQLERWTDAAAALDQSLAKGGLKEPGDAQLLLGYALYSQGSVEAARAFFERALSSPASSKQARGWLDQIAKEKEEEPG